MAATRAFLRTIKRNAAYVWDWPVVKGARFTPAQRDRMNELSRYLSVLASVSAGTLLVYGGSPVWLTVAGSAVAVIGGHYLAGLLAVLRR